MAGQAIAALGTDAPPGRLRYENVNEVTGVPAGNAASVCVPAAEAAVSALSVP
jgi:hypothetical protein